MVPAPVTVPEQVLAALAPLPPAYVGRLVSVTAMLSARDDVLALWVSGSVARDAADAGSDLDLVVTVTDAAYDAFDDPAVWSVLEPVICLRLPGMPGCFAMTTPDGLRVDVVVEVAGDLAATPYRRRLRVFDHDGSVVPVPEPEPGPGPDPDRLGELVQEFLRQSAIFPAAVLAREDWLLGQESVIAYRTLLYRIFVEANQPLPPMGIKQWSSRLTPHQRDVLAALPLPTPDRESVVAAIVAARRALRSEGRAAVQAAGARWPTELDEQMAALWTAGGLPG